MKNKTVTRVKIVSLLCVAPFVACLVSRSTGISYGTTVSFFTTVAGASFLSYVLRKRGVRLRSIEIICWLITTGASINFGMTALGFEKTLIAIIQQRIALDLDFAENFRADVQGRQFLSQQKQAQRELVVAKYHRRLEKINKQVQVGNITIEESVKLMKNATKQYNKRMVNLGEIAIENWATNILSSVGDHAMQMLKSTPVSTAKHVTRTAPLKFGQPARFPHQPLVYKPNGRPLLDADKKYQLQLDKRLVVRVRVPSSQGDVPEPVQRRLTGFPAAEVTLPDEQGNFSSASLVGWVAMTNGVEEMQIVSSTPTPAAALAHASAATVYRYSLPKGVPAWATQVTLAPGERVCANRQEHIRGDGRPLFFIHVPTGKKFVVGAGERKDFSRLSPGGHCFEGGPLGNHIWLWPAT